MAFHLLAMPNHDYLCASSSTLFTQYEAMLLFFFEQKSWRLSWWFPDCFYCYIWLWMHCKSSDYSPPRQLRTHIVPNPLLYDADFLNFQSSNWGHFSSFRFESPNLHCFITKLMWILVMGSSLRSKQVHLLEKQSN